MHDLDVALGIGNAMICGIQTGFPGPMQFILSDKPNIKQMQRRHELSYTCTQIKSTSVYTMVMMKAHVISVKACMYVHCI